jgi:hypothetical protein
LLLKRETKNMSEFGPRPREVAGNEIDDITANWESLLSHVYSNDATRTLILKVIKRYRTSYPEDKEGVKEALRNLREELSETDDEEEIREILNASLGEGAEDLDDEDENELEEEDEAA